MFSDHLSYDVWKPDCFFSCVYNSISQQECRFVELQAERLLRRAEGKKRRATEMKIKEDAMSKRRIAEVPKTTRQKGSASSRSAIPLRRIEEGGISDDDFDTHGSFSIVNDWENTNRSSDTSLRGVLSAAEPLDEMATGPDDGVVGKQSITSAIVALKLRDLSMRSDSLADKDIFMDSRSPPPKPPKPVKPPRHSDQVAAVTVSAVGPSSVFQLPDSIRDVIGSDTSSTVTQPQPLPLPPVVTKANGTEMETESLAVPRTMSLRPKSVKFSMTFLDQTDESYQRMLSTPQFTKVECQDRHVVAQVDPLDSSSQDLYAPTHSRPTSRRLRPTSVDTRRQRSGFTVNPVDVQKSGTANKSLSNLLPQTLSSSDHSGSLESIQDSGLSNSNRAHEMSITEEGVNGLRASKDITGGSAVSAILARRKHLEDDSDVSDSDKDSDSDWE